MAENELVITLRIPASLVTDLDKRAAAESRTRSAIIRMACHAYLRAAEEEREYAWPAMRIFARRKRSGSHE